jgi:hypothetical protein
MANDFKVRNGLIVAGSGSTLFSVQGSQGSLFSVTDSLSGSLFAATDISGVPVLEVFSDDIVKAGTFNNEGLIVNGTNITSSGNISASGFISAFGSSSLVGLPTTQPTTAGTLWLSGSADEGGNKFLMVYTGS